MTVFEKGLIASIDMLHKLAYTKLVFLSIVGTESDLKNIDNFVVMFHP